MDDLDKHLSTLGEAPTLRDALWHASAGRLRATVAVSEEGDAQSLLELSSSEPGQLGRLILYHLHSAERTDEQAVPFEFFEPDESVPNIEGQYHILLDQLDVDILLTLIREDYKETPLDRR